ncbi:MAG: hypothetical protein OXC81_05160 [Betaproteobacteria bacterium]|nr:hypothetical protein [Betaproteobacteria bacterium]
MKEELPILRASYDRRLRELQEQIAAGCPNRIRSNETQDKAGPANPDSSPPAIPARILRRLFAIINDRI